MTRGVRQTYRRADESDTSRKVSVARRLGRCIPVVLVALLAAVPAAARGPTVVVRDQLRDARGGAADIDTLQVSNERDRIVLRLTFADRRALTDDDLVALVLDSDADRSSGFRLFERDGIDALVLLSAAAATLVDLNGLMTQLPPPLSSGVAPERDPCDLPGELEPGLVVAREVDPAVEARDGRLLRPRAQALRRAREVRSEHLGGRAGGRRVAADVGRERRRDDVRQPGRVELAPDGGHRPLRPVGELRVPAGDESVRLGGVQRDQHVRGRRSGEPVGGDQLERDPVPVPRRRLRPGPSAQKAAMRRCSSVRARETA
jgi:hypothetical protein